MLYVRVCVGCTSASKESGDPYVRHAHAVAKMDLCDEYGRTVRCLKRDQAGIRISVGSQWYLTCWCRT